MKYTQRSFSVSAPMSDAYRDGWERCFGKKNEGAEVPSSERFHTQAPTPAAEALVRASNLPRDPQFDKYLDEVLGLGKPPVCIARTELAKWLEDLGHDEFQTLHVRRVAESIKLVLQAYDKGNQNGP